MRVWVLRSVFAAGVAALLTACGGQQTQQAGAAPASSSSEGGAQVALTGCPSPAATGSCIIMKGQGGKLYDVTNASPKINLSSGHAVSVTGSETTTPSACGAAATVLADAQSSELGMKCGIAAPPAAASAAGDKGKAAG